VVAVRTIVDLMRRDRDARWFFLAYGQSSLGTGAAYVALLLVAYSRFHSPWALALVLLADFVPPMLLAPIAGAAADRWPRQICAVAADALRAGAFLGIAFTSSFPLTVVLALAAGAGTAIYKPAIMAGLPEIVGRDRLSPATAVYGALTEIGFTVGPGMAALVLLFGSPKLLLLVNAGTFALSALTVALIRFRYREAPEPGAVERKSLIREARDGLVVVARLHTAFTVIVATSTILLFAGMVNVAELLLAQHLGGGRAGYSLFVAIGGLGVALGSLMGASGGGLPGLVRRYLAGVVLVAAGLLGTAAAPTYASALVPLAALGFGNGMLIVYERLILQRTVATEFLGRAFGTHVSLDGFAFAASFLCGGVVLAVVPPRALFLIGGVGAILVWILARLRFRKVRVLEESPAAEDPAGSEGLMAGGAAQR
jgi:MFS family permease